MIGTVLFAVDSASRWLTADDAVLRGALQEKGVEVRPQLQGAASTGERPKARRVLTQTTPEQDALIDIGMS